MTTPNFTFKTKVRIWTTAKASWYFVFLPKKLSKDLDSLYADQKRGWGSLPVEIKTGNAKWTTSIFPDKPNKTYILPLKKVIRDKEKLIEGCQVRLDLTVII